MLEMQNSTYCNLIKNISPENYEFACIYAESEIDLIDGFKDYFEEKENLSEDEIKDLRIDSLVEFIGKGYYDYAGRNFDADTILRIDEIMEQEVDSKILDIYKDKNKVINNIKSKYDSNFTYGIFGISISKQKSYLEYIVSSSVELSQNSIYETLKNNGIKPYAWGCGTAPTDEFYNMYPKEIKDMDEEELSEVIIKDELEAFIYNH